MSLIVNKYKSIQAHTCNPSTQKGNGGGLSQI